MNIFSCTVVNESVLKLKKSYNSYLSDIHSLMSSSVLSDTLTYLSIVPEDIIQSIKHSVELIDSERISQLFETLKEKVNSHETSLEDSTKYVNAPTVISILQSCETIAKKSFDEFKTFEYLDKIFSEKCAMHTDIPDSWDGAMRISSDESGKILVKLES